MWERPAALRLPSELLPTPARFHQSTHPTDPLPDLCVHFVITRSRVRVHVTSTARLSFACPRNMIHLFQIQLPTPCLQHGIVMVTMNDELERMQNDVVANCKVPSQQLCNLITVYGTRKLGNYNSVTNFILIIVA